MVHWEIVLDLSAQLVMAAVDQHRETLEEACLVDISLPDHRKFGPEYWHMNLRNMGTFYLPVGNKFSGLWCPIELAKKV